MTSGITLGMLFAVMGGQPESRIWTVRCNSIAFGSSDVFTCTIKVYLTVKTMDILVSSEGHFERLAFIPL